MNAKTLLQMAKIIPPRVLIIAGKHYQSLSVTISHQVSPSITKLTPGVLLLLLFLCVPIPRSYKHFIFTAGQSQHLTVRLLDVPIQFMLFLSNRLSRPSIFIHVLSTSKSFLSKSLFHAYPALQLFLCVFHTLTVLIQHYAVKILARFSKE